MQFQVIIPARYGSTRLPKKALLDIAGKPMIQHVYERCVASGAETVVIATDDERIVKAAKKFHAPVCLTSSEHKTGTDRIAQAVDLLSFEDDDIVVSVQCDEPLIPPKSICQVARTLEEHNNVKATSLCDPILDVETLFNPNVVKVVLNHRNYAIYFSRAPIPWERDSFSQERSKITLHGEHFRHIGLYAYRVGFLRDYANWAECTIEGLESLEQLRILWHGGRIYMSISTEDVPHGVDTEEDIEKVRAILKA